jgi:sugar phosphate permease
LILFLVFLAAYILSQFFRAFLAVIAPRLAQELGLSGADLANMSAAWFAVFAFAQFPLGVALDRIGPRRTVPVLMLAGVAGSLLLSQAQGARDCVLALALIGLGCSPIYMGALYYYGRTVSPARFGFVTASLLGFGSAGNLLAATPLAYATQVYGWRLTVAVIGVVMLAAAGLFALLVRDPPIARNPDAVRRSAIGELAQVVTLPRFWTLMPLVALGYAAVVAERGLWVGAYFADVHELGPVALGNAVLVMAVAMTAGALAFGSIERVMGRSKLLVVIGSVLTGLCFGLLWVWQSPSVLVGVALMAGIGFMGLCQPVLFAHARQFFPDYLLGRGMTFANFLTIGGAGLLQFVSGAYVSQMQSAGLPPSEVYGALHLAFALITFGALAVYLFSPAPPFKAKQG